MALPALGNQAVLESVCGFGQDEALVDCYHAAHHCGRLCLYSFRTAQLPLFPTHLSRLLAGGLHLGYP